MSRQRLAILVVACAAIWLRVWHLFWGVDDGGWFPDEVFLSGAAAAFVPFRWESIDIQNLIYPTLAPYLAGACASLGHSLGLFDRMPDGADPWALIAARVAGAVVGIAAVALVGRLGQRLYGGAVGLGAAALMAVVPFHVMLGHIAGTDLTLVACVALTLLAALRLVEAPTATRAALAGAAAGLAFASKYTGLALIVPVLWALGESAYRARSSRFVFAGGIGVLVGFAAATALACPPCALRADAMLAAMKLHRMRTTVLYRGFGSNILVPSLGWYGRPYLYQLVASLPYVLGWPMYLTALAGVGLALRRHTAEDRVVLVMLFSYFAAMASSVVVFPRYLLPLVPGLVVVAARLLLGPGRASRLRAAVLAAVLLYSFALSATQVARFSTRHQRGVVDFLATQTPRPERVTVPDILHYFRLTERLSEAGLKTSSATPGHWLDGQPDAFVLPEWLATAIRRDNPPGSPEVRELDALTSGASGYVEVARWRSSYLQRDFYAWLDPAFAGDLWQGEIGFSVYLRKPKPGETPH